MTRRHVVILSSILPPDAGGGTPRLLRNCEYLPRFGWRVSLAGFRGKPLPESLTNPPPGVPLTAVNVDAPLRRIRRKLRSMIGAAKRRPPWPDAFRPLLPRLLKNIRRKARHDPPDAVLVSIPSFSFLDADFLRGLQDLCPGRIVVEQRDLFSGNDLPASPEDIERALRMEAAAADCIDGVTEDSDYNLNHFARSWLPRARYAVAPNAFSEIVHAPFRLPDHWPGKREGFLRIVYTGMAYAGNRPALLIPGIERAIAARPELRSRLRFVFYGHYQSDAMGDWSHLPGIFENRGAAPYRDIPAILAQADALATIIAETPAAQGTPGGKVIEYLGARRPILALSSGAAGDIVRAAQAGMTIDPHDPEAIARALLILDDHWVNDRPFPLGAEELSAPWEANTVVKGLAGLLEEVVENDKSRR